MNAPTNSPARYLGTSLQSVTPIVARPSVTAGFRCAPLKRLTAKMAIMTAMPQPKVMTIHPPFSALERAKSVAATTPSPRRIRIAVPITSAPKMLNPDLPIRSTDPGPYGRGAAASTRKRFRNGARNGTCVARLYRNLPVRLVGGPSGGLDGGRLAFGPDEPAHGRRRVGALEQCAHALHDLGLRLVLADPDGRAELDLDRMTAAQEAGATALGPVLARRHRIMRAADADRHDGDLVGSSDHGGAGAQPADAAVA